MTAIGRKGTPSQGPGAVVRVCGPQESKDPAGSGGVKDRQVGEARRSAAALAEGGRLADALAQEVQLRAADLAVAQDFDLLDARAVDLERALDAHARRDPAHRDRSGDAAAAQS